ncbi:MAG: hypothetical protein LWX83_04495 [Anaerolineae bacterium]|nr:hypothetical protein [Anaerolineae bacterium]
MKTSNSYFSRRLKIGTFILAAGMIVTIAGTFVSILQPEAQSLRKWIISMGFLLLGIGTANFIRYYSISQNAIAARRAELAEKDERSLMIRNQAGYSAYLFSTVVAYGALMIYSNLTQSTPGFDFFWFYLVFAAVAPSIFYIIYLTWLHKHY